VLVQLLKHLLRLSAAPLQKRLRLPLKQHALQPTSSKILALTAPPTAVHGHSAVTLLLAHPTHDRPPTICKQIHYHRQKQIETHPFYSFFAAEIGNGPIQQDIPNLDLSKAYQFSYYYTRGEFFDSTDCVITVKAGAALLDTNPIVSTSPKFLYTKRRFYVSAGTLSSTTIEINASCGNFNGGTDILVDDSMEVVCHD
jgi:hypothetical protein